MRLMALTVDGNEYLSQSSAIDAATIDEVNRNSCYVLRGRNVLDKYDGILRANRLQGYLTRFETSLVVEKGLELSRKKDTKVAGEVDPGGGAASGQRFAHQAGFGHGVEFAAETGREPVAIEGIGFSWTQGDHRTVQLS